VELREYKKNLNSFNTHIRKANYFHLFQEKEKVKNFEKTNNYKKTALVFFLLIIGLVIALIK